MSSRYLLIILMLLPIATAQEPPEPPRPEENVYHFDLEADVTYGEMIDHPFVDFTMVFSDLSKDSSGGLIGQSGGNVQAHQTSWNVVFPEGLDRSGYQVNFPSALNTFGGDVREVDFRVQMLAPQVKTPLLQFEMVATTRAPNYEVVNRVQFAVLSFGPENWLAQPVGSLQIEPGESAAGTVKISNGNLLPRTFGVEITENTCGLTAAVPPTVVVGPKDAVNVAVDVRGPEDRFYYASELCEIKVGVFAVDQSANVITVPMSIQVSGVYVDPVWVFWAIGIALFIFFLILFILRRKAAIEEELLGKPQRPWTIPVERVYLEHLEARDPRAAYVVRHFLMEEEYRSALLWYSGYKKATRGERAKESLVVRQEKAYARFQKKWERKIAAPMKDVDKLEASLQKKLDRDAKGNVRKERRAWKKKVAKLEQAHAAQYSKAMSKWEKEAKKAEKKGQPAPPQPVEGAPDLPAEPAMDRIMLADHKWQKKVDKARKKAIKKQGNIEVKFEKKDARMLHKVQKKVQKIAKKIDDPDFAAEHPLVGQKVD